MTKQQQLLNFIKSGPNCTRRWGECREFYATLCKPLFKPGLRQGLGGQYWLTPEQAYTYNVRYRGRAMDYALYRLETKGLTANIAHGLHQAT